jgi:hypothetical protein
MPHSMTKSRPLAPTYVMASEDGQARFEGVVVALLEVTVELTDEVWPDTDVAVDDCDAEDPALELTVEETLDEAPPVVSLAPQIEGLLFAEPRVCFR